MKYRVKVLLKAFTLLFFFFILFFGKRKNRCSTKKKGWDTRQSHRWENFSISSETIHLFTIDIGTISIFKNESILLERFTLPLGNEFPLTETVPFKISRIQIASLNTINPFYVGVDASRSRHDQGD